MKGTEIILRAKSLPEIESNLDEVQVLLDQELEKYRDYVVTEDNMKDAKSDKAMLNKLAKEVSDRRIALKKEYMEPFDGIEQKAKNITSMIKDVTDNIDKQIKTYDEIERAEKYANLAVMWDGIAGDKAEVLPFDRIKKDKWMNKTTSLKQAEVEMKSLMTEVTTNLLFIDNLPEGEERTRIKGAYLRTLNMAAALEERQRFHEEQRAVKAFDTGNPFDRIPDDDRDSAPVNVTIPVAKKRYIIIDTTNVPRERFKALSDLLAEYDIPFVIEER